MSRIASTPYSTLRSSSASGATAIAAILGLCACSASADQTTSRPATAPATQATSMTDHSGTEHAGKEGSDHKFTNRLAKEMSPYLLQHAHRSFEELMQSLSSAADGVADVTGPELRENLTSTLAGADSLMERLNATSENIEGVLGSFETILTRIENGDGTLGQLWASDSLYTSAMGVIETFRLLLEDIQENPGRYLSFNASIF